MSEKLIGILATGSTGDFEAISREARITHAILLTLLAQSAPELAGEATARIVQIPDLHHFIALSLRRLAVAWHYSDEHQLAKDFLSSLLFFWLTAGQDLAAFPIQQLGYGVAKDFLQEHGVTVVAQLWVTGQVSQLR